MDAALKPIILILLTLVITSVILLWAGLDGTFLIDWVYNRIGDFMSQVQEVIGEAAPWPDWIPWEGWLPGPL